MITFRYHIVSLVAVFLALALGIVVGTTALNGPVTSDLRRQVDDLKKQRVDLAAQNKDLTGQVDASGQFITTFGSQIVADQLKDVPTLVIALPGTSTGMVDGIATLLSSAGAKITGRLELTSAFTDPAQGESLRTLATGAAHPVSLTLPPTDDDRVVGAALLAYVAVGNGQVTDLKTVLSGLSGLHMITSDPAAIEAAKNVVVVGNGSHPNGSYAGAAELDLVTQLIKAEAKVVVAGDAGTANADGIVASVRSGTASSAVSTVDNANTAAGQVSTTLALADVINSDVGQYGTAKGATALFPTTSK